MDLNEVKQTAELGELLITEHDQYEELKEAVAGINRALDSYKRSMDKEKTATPIGQQFDYGGKRFVVAAHGTRMDYKLAYECALRLVPKTKQEILKTTVAEECKTITKSAKEV